MKNRGLMLVLPALVVGWAPYAHAQWMQWGQNGAHTSFLPTVQAQSPDQINWTFASLKANDVSRLIEKWLRFLPLEAGHFS